MRPGPGRERAAELARGGEPAVERPGRRTPGLAPGDTVADEVRSDRVERLRQRGDRLARPLDHADRDVGPAPLVREELQ